MIRDGILTYPNAHSPLYQWRPSQDFLYELITGFLATLIFYQATAMLTDMAFGFKEKGNVSVSNLGTYILVCNMSFHSISALLSKFGKAISRSVSASKLRVGFKCFALLLLMSIVRILTISLTIENNRAVSFKEAGFGGLALGLGEGRTVESVVKYFGIGYPLEVDYGQFDTPIAEFYSDSIRLSTPVQEPNELLSNATSVLIHIQAGDNETFYCNIQTNLLRYTVIRNANVVIKGKRYKVKKGMSIDQGKKLLRKIRTPLLRECADVPSPHIHSGAPPVRHRFRKERGWDIYTVVRCRPYRSEIGTAAIMFRDGISVINSNRRSLRPENGSEESSAWDDLVLFERRSAALSVPLLLIVAVSVTCLRLLLCLFMHNDVILGVEAIVKHRVGIPCCDSILPSTHVIEYKENLFRIV